MDKECAYELFMKGKQLLKERNPAQAAVLLERAKRIEPEKGSIREELAQAYYNYKQYESAKREFGKAIEIDPTNHYAHFGLGLCMNHLGLEVGARKHLRIALAMEPESLDYKKALEKIEGIEDG